MLLLLLAPAGNRLTRAVLCLVDAVGAPANIIMVHHKTGSARKALNIISDSCEESWLEEEHCL